MPTGVTPAGIRAGEPDSLAGLVALRGSAVRAYAGAVAGPEGTLAAAAEAMASFRAQVVRAPDVRELDPDALLLRASRESSAARAPRPAESGAMLRRLARRRDSPCDLAPRLLAARANRELSHEDAVRLDRHMASCPPCRGLRERFRTAENLYAEGAGTPLVERDARALLVALARAAPLADGTPQSVADEALALLPTDTVRRPGPTPSAASPAEAPRAKAPVEEAPVEAPPVEAPPSPSRPPVTPPPSSAEAPRAPERRADPWPGNAAPAGDRPPQRATPGEAPSAPDSREVPRPNGAHAAGAPAARPAGGIGTAHGRVSFARRTVIIRSGVEPSGTAAPSPPPSASPQSEGSATKLPVAPSEPEPAEHPRPQADEPDDASEAHEQSSSPLGSAPVADLPASDDVPARPEHRSDADSPDLGTPVRPPAVRTSPPAPTPTPGSGPGAPPDSGTLARIVPGILIVMAIAIALLIAGILGPGKAPATSDDIEPPGLREPVGNRDTTGTLRTPPAPGAGAGAATPAN